MEAHSRQAGILGRERRSNVEIERPDMFNGLMLLAGLGSIAALCSSRVDQTPSAGCGFESASIEGIVVFEGERPATSFHEVDGPMREVCGHRLHGDRRLILDPDGGIANILVVLERQAIEGDPTPMATKGSMESSPTLTKLRCGFEPRILLARKNQPITLKNAGSPCNGFMIRGRFNDQRDKMLATGSSAQTEFAKAEVISVTCNVRPRDMVAFIAVLDTEHNAITGQDGRFRFDDLPPGTYTLKIWHELHGWDTPKAHAKIELTAGCSHRLSLELPSTWFKKR